MEEIYDTVLLCDKCTDPTQKSYVVKDGIKIRTWHCIKCNKKWHHPTDLEDYHRFKEIKMKDFEVKLRPVGNSWTVSIPKEIINFQEVTRTKIVHLSLNEPGKIVLRFKKVKKVY
ncbi:MAG: hypothetical protein ABIF40_05970 [archaeon]